MAGSFTIVSDMTRNVMFAFQDFYVTLLGIKRSVF